MAVGAFGCAPSCAAKSLKARANPVSSNIQVAFYEKVLEAAGTLRLERLSSLVEWECRQLVNTVTVSGYVFVILRKLSALGRFVGVFLPRLDRIEYST